MAERRMFSKKITESDAFLELPFSAQALYLHLNMAADDDGFVNGAKGIQRAIGAKPKDLEILINKRFILAFESGVVVIKHWKVNNYIQADRYRQTVYKEELSKLTIKDNKAYTECIQDVSKMDTSLDTKWIQNGYSLDTQDRIGKDRLGKVSIVEDSKGKDSIGEDIYLNVKDSETESNPQSVDKSSFHSRLDAISKRVLGEANG